MNKNFINKKFLKTKLLKIIVIYRTSHKQKFQKKKWMSWTDMFFQ